MNQVTPIRRISHTNFSRHARREFVAGKSLEPRHGERVVIAGEALIVHSIGDDIAMVPPGYNREGQLVERSRPTLFSFFV